MIIVPNKNINKDRKDWKTQWAVLTRWIYRGLCVLHERAHIFVTCAWNVYENWPHSKLKSRYQKMSTSWCHILWSILLSLCSNFLSIKLPSSKLPHGHKMAATTPAITSMCLVGKRRKREKAEGCMLTESTLFKKLCL